MAHYRIWNKEEVSEQVDLINRIQQQQSPLEKVELELFNLQLQLKNYLRTDQIPDLGTSPGTYIQAGMSAFKQHLNISNTKLARYWGMTTQNLSKYLKGERSLNIELTFKIAATFDWPPELLLNVQHKNELQQYDDYETYKEKYDLENLLHSRA